MRVCLSNCMKQSMLIISTQVKGLPSTAKDIMTQDLHPPTKDETNQEQTLPSLVPPIPSKNKEPLLHPASSLTTNDGSSQTRPGISLLSAAEAEQEPSLPSEDLPLSSKPLLCFQSDDKDETTCQEPSRTLIICIM